MTINDSENTRTAHVIHTTEVRESNAAGWWIGALVAIVAMLAVVFLVYSAQNPASDAQLTNAMEQGRMQSALENAQSDLVAAQDQARAAADQAAAATEQAREATANAAASAVDAAADAQAVIIEPAPAQ